MHMRRYWWYAGSNPNPNPNPDPNPDLAHEEVLVVGGVCVEVADELEGARAHGELLVDEELVRGFEEETLHLGAR